MSNPLIIQTSGERDADLENFIRQSHPYELPEIVALRAEGGLPACLDWVLAQCGA